MSGNVWELFSDWWGKDYKDERFANRYGTPPDYISDDLGFCICRTIPKVGLRGNTFFILFTPVSSMAGTVLPAGTRKWWDLPEVW